MTNNPEMDLIQDIAAFQHDPYGYVLYAFSWGEGELLGREIRAWQKDTLIQIGEKLKTGQIDVSEAVQIAIASGHGIGKAHDVETIIPTPNGLARWGDLKIGNYVFGSDGKPVKILNTRSYNHITRYKVTFDDGSSSDVSSGHLWNVKGS